MEDKQAEEIIKIFQDQGMLIELGEQFSAKGQIAQLINGVKEIINRQTPYENNEFCRDICCPYLADKCTIDNCLQSAKEFHKWLHKNGYNITMGL